MGCPEPYRTEANPAQWYAVQTRSRFEKAVCAELQRKGLEPYLPTVQEVHEWKDRKKLVELPLFSGYLFARLADVNAARLPILKTAGVVQILGTGGAMVPVPDLEIESIRLVLSSGNPCWPYPMLREGKWVRIRRGPLAGVEGRLVRIKKQCRLVLSVELLAQAIATEVDARDVEPARERSH